MQVKKKLESFWPHIKKSLPVLSICLVLNAGMLFFMRLHNTGKLGTAGTLFVNLENQLLDLRFLLRGKEKPSGKIGILALDEKSIQKFGRWPFTRSVYEQAFKNLKKAGVNWIGFDVVWDKPELPLLADAMPVINSLRTSPKQETQGLIAKINQLNEIGLADQSVARTIREFGNIVLGYMYYGVHERGNLEALKGREFSGFQPIQNAAIQAVIMPEGFDLTKYKDLSVGAVVANTDFIGETSPHFGFFNNDPDGDSVVRWVNLVKEANGSLLPSMSLKMASAITQREIVTIFDRIGVEEIMLMNPEDDKDVIKIPVDPLGNGRALLNHLGPSMTLKHVSLADAWDNSFSEKDRKVIKGMSLMMGPTAMAINDMRANPFDVTFNGVEQHATMIDNIVSKRFFKRPADIFYLEIRIVLWIGIILSLMLAFSSAFVSFFGAAMIAIAYYYIDRHFWFSKGIWVYMGMPYIQIAGLFMVVTIYKYFTEEREKKKVKGAFQHYLSPDVMNQVLDNPDKLKLGGERRECTVFFSDVRGFTTISESLTPEKLVELMNDYLSPMTELILRSGGVLDKYIGDAIMAFWGAPLDRPDQADVAAQTVLRMMEKLQEIRRDFPKKSFPPIDIGCGVNTGMMSVGNMGSSERFAYTVMGDSVNLGARLESITKEYGVRSILSEFTVAKLQQRQAYFLREMDDIKVKGKKEPVKIFELIHPMILPNEAAVRDLLGEFHGLREAYRAQDWDLAKKHLQSCLLIRPDDGPSKLYNARIEELSVKPRIENWDGVHEFHHK